jgi:hypothetical protein
MKTFAVILLCASLLLEGCYSYRAIAQDENGRDVLNPVQNIKIVQKDDPEIKVEPHRYISVEMPSSFEYSTGIRFDKVRDSSCEFSRCEFYLADGVATQSDPGKFVVIDSAQGQDLSICQNESVSTWTNIDVCNARIPIEECRKIEDIHLSTEINLLVVGGIVVGSFMMLLLALAVSHPKVG